MTLPYKFSPFLFLRSPAYSIQDFRVSKLSQVLNQEFFRTALYFSSPVLYKQLQERGFESERLTKGMEESLLRYYNRMCYRATPFGMFSSFSHIQWAPGGEGLVFSGIENIFVQADYRLSQHIASKAISAGMPDYYYANPSIYILGKELRFIKAGKSESLDKEVQGLSAVTNSGFLSRLIQLAKKGISLEHLREVLLEAYPSENPDELINDLLAEELLFSELLPNVTGENYLKRIAPIIQDENITTLSKTLSASTNLNEVGAEKMQDLISPFLGTGESIRSPFYVNFEKEVCGSLDADHQADLMAGLYCLSHLQTSNDKTAIARFRKRFLDRFDEQEVLLMVALDPEAGIGYEFLEETADQGELLKDITFEEPKESRQISWGPLQEMLMNKLSWPNSSGAISLTDEDLEQLPKNTGLLTPGLSVMFRLANEKVFIETAGGTTSTALVGRFSSFSEAILAELRDLAKAEQAANPDVIFAEIAYSTEEHASNINTRQHIRDYEIPVLVHSTLPRANVIGLNDLYVSVYRNEVVLRSAKLGRRIVPRLSTAYNHIRSELPVFRFLSDLQYQGISSGLSFKPENLIPGLTYYPRIEYKNCILAEASWIIRKSEISKIHNVQSFLDFAGQRTISRYFALSESDKQLVFDLQDHNGLELLVSQFKNNEQVILKEFFIGDESKNLLTDKTGNPYVHQFVACLINTTKSYSFDLRKPKQNRHTKRYVSPGGNWIYFKIYCSPQNANNILLGRIFPLIKKYTSRIDKWFFIRYHDPDHHLRIRIHGNNEFIADLPRLFNTLLKTFFKHGLISRLQIDTYVREVERYGAKGIEQAEQVFRYSSDVILQYLSGDKDEIQIIQFAVLSNHKLLGSFNLHLSGRITLLEKICTNLITEMGTEKQLRNDLNKKYRHYQQIVSECMSDEKVFLNRPERMKMNSLCAEAGTLDSVFTKTTPARRDSLISDILHMHMNRLFSSDQRKKELVIYYLCLRYYLSQMARSGSRLT